MNDGVHESIMWFPADTIALKPELQAEDGSEPGTRLLLRLAQPMVDGVFVMSGCYLRGIGWRLFGVTGATAPEILYYSQMPQGPWPQPGIEKLRAAAHDIAGALMEKGYAQLALMQFPHPKVMEQIAISFRAPRQMVEVVTTFIKGGAPDQITWRAERILKGDMDRFLKMSWLQVLS